MKDHEKARLITELTNIARTYANTQQLRQRIANVLLPVLATCEQQTKTENQMSKTRVQPKPMPYDAPINTGATQEQFAKAGCHLVTETGIASAVVLFNSIYQATDGNPCDGCSYYENGKCEAYKSLLRNRRYAPRQSPGIPQAAQETVKQEATRRGISLAQVRKERKEQYWAAKEGK